MSSLESAFEYYEQLYKTIIQADTWGYPRPNIKYRFRATIASCEDGLNTIVRSITESDCNNPIFWEDVTNILLGKIPDSTGDIYIFDGYYLKYKNGNCRFSGKTKKINLYEKKEENND